jgi:hypothetical protein
MLSQTAEIGQEQTFMMMSGSHHLTSTCLRSCSNYESFLR